MPSLRGPLAGHLELTGQARGSACSEAAESNSLPFKAWFLPHATLRIRGQAECMVDHTSVHGRITQTGVIPRGWIVLALALTSWLVPLAAVFGFIQLSGQLL